MIPQPDGTLLPNPDATATNTVEAYPLTYVEYAIAPTQPLLNGNCSARTKAQTDLVDWLNYMTGPGQAELAKGLAPSHPNCRPTPAGPSPRSARPPTGPCAPVTAPAATPPGSSPSAAAPAAASTSSGGSVTSTGSAGTGSFSSASSAGATTYGAGGYASATSSTVPSAGSTTANAKTATGGNMKPVLADLSAFKTLAGMGWLLPVLGVLLLIFLLPGLALVVAGRSPRQALAALTGRTDRAPDPLPGPPP